MELKERRGQNGRDYAERMRNMNQKENDELERKHKQPITGYTEGKREACIYDKESKGSGGGGEKKVK